MRVKEGVKIYKIVVSYFIIIRFESRHPDEEVKS